MTRHFFVPVLRTHKIDKVAFIARVGTFGIGIVDAGQGILKDRFVLPGRAN